MVSADMFFGDGASYGLLFQARNNMAFAANINQQRQERVKAGSVKEERVRIGGREVSYLATPDGAVRSYYAVDGDFHFVATSRRLIERFLATVSGETSLGKSDEFRHARSIMPLSRNDTATVYVSDAFFRNITAPRCRVEMARRLQAAADIELVELARLAAVAEGQPNETIEQLKKASLLPPEFGPLPDGSDTVLNAGIVSNTLRGRRGAFLPADDVSVDRITQAEAAEYKRFVEFYRRTGARSIRSLPP